MSRFESLEETFELPKLEDSLQEIPQTTLEQAQELAKELVDKDHFELHDLEMDQIADLAVEYGKNLHELGMNVEVKHSGEIFNASSNMLKIALDAKNAKMEKKLKMLRLELDRLKLDRTNPDPGETIQHDSVTVLDRNQLLGQIKSLSAGNAK